MSDWLHSLPVIGICAVVFGATYAVTAGIYVLIVRLANGERAKAFKAVTPGLLPPLGIMFGLLIAFVAAQVWGDLDRAHAAVNHEASALRSAVLLSKAFPPETQGRLQELVRQHIDEARNNEWPAMARHDASLTMIPTALGQALEIALMTPVTGEGQVVAQRELVSALGSALEARRQRILISGSAVNWVKWTAMLLQAVITLVAIAMVHIDNRATAKIALGLFATAIALCVLLIVVHDRPFTGQLGVPPSTLVQVRP